MTGKRRARKPSDIPDAHAFYCIEEKIGQSIAVSQMMMRRDCRTVFKTGSRQRFFQIFDALISVLRELITTPDRGSGHSCRGMELIDTLKWDEAKTIG